MATIQAGEPTPRKPLRVWPGVIAAVLLVIGRYLFPLIVPGTGGTAILAGIAGGLFVLVWWLFFSRARWPERVGAIVLMIVAGFATWPLLHISIRNGLMGRMFIVYSIPVVSLALVAWAVATRRLPEGARRASMVGAIVLAFAAMTLVRTGGVTGDAGSDIQWRWTPTPEERLLARTRNGGAPGSPTTFPPTPPATATPESSALPTGSGTTTSSDRRPTTGAGEAPAAVATTPEPAAEKRTADESPRVDPGFARAAWPGFRGPARDGAIRGVRVETDWTGNPPIELWRRPIGPGWGSFAVAGDLVYTQEQRGEHEVVSCYRLTTGEPVWMHRDAARFWESNAGAGPRATPTVHGGRVYTLGATGLVNALDARTGAVVWSRNAAADTGAPLPGWGFAGSPLVFDDLVIVAASGRLVGYEIATGKPRWTQTTGGGGYSSPHVATIGGVPHILLGSGGLLTSVAPDDGRVLWQHTWHDGVSIVQPAVTADDQILIAGGDMMGGIGMRRLAVSKIPSDQWQVEERWKSRGLKPYFNDFVVHEGHAFGFDGSIMSCISIEDGERKWKGGRYGHGQLLLLPEQDVLLVLSEEGELALVRAASDGHTALARFKAIEGKTWNHPVLAGDVLLVRNGEEMAAFRLALVR